MAINNEIRENFMQAIYDMFSNEPTNEKANQIIDLFDAVTEDCTNLPCKKGDTVFVLVNGKPIEYKYDHSVVILTSETEGMFLGQLSDFDKQFFLTQKEAVQASKMENKSNG